MTSSRSISFTFNTAPRLGDYSARILHLSGLDGEFVRQWASLESHCIELNAYLSPDFVLPAIEHLGDKDDILFLAIYRVDSDDSDNGQSRERLCGLGIFRYSKGTRYFPLPHLVAFKSIHSYLTGMLIDAKDSEVILNIMVQSLVHLRPKIHGVYISNLPSQGCAKLLSSRNVCRGCVFWFEGSKKERAFLRIAEINKNEDWDSHVSPKRRKNYRRAVKGLSDYGDLEWRIYIGNEVTQRNIDNFLEMEHSAWKVEKKTSLLSARHDEEFFQRMTRSFKSKGRIFFTELCLDGNVIASTCNLMLGEHGFAFKVGYDDSWQKFSPGIVNEMEFLRHLRTLSMPIVEIDSGAGEMSFINSYWPDRKQLVSGVLTITLPGKLSMKILGSIRKLKQIVKN